MNTVVHFVPAGPSTVHVSTSFFNSPFSMSFKCHASLPSSPSPNFNIQDACRLSSILTRPSLASILANSLGDSKTTLKGASAIGIASLTVSFGIVEPRPFLMVIVLVQRTTSWLAANRYVEAGSFSCLGENVIWMLLSTPREQVKRSCGETCCTECNHQLGRKLPHSHSQEWLYWLHTYHHKRRKPDLAGEAGW